MGLDMSLYREVSLKDKMKITDKAVGEVLNEDTMRPIARHEVCYWRKFNALHKYFYDHFGNETEDNCVDMYLDIDDIKKTLELVKEIKSKVKLGKGFVSSYESGVDKKDIGEHKVGDEVLSEVKKVREVEDSITSVIVLADRGDYYYLDFRHDGKVITNPEVCEELPTQEGFFFGGTEYDEYYVYHLDDTIEQLEKVIEEHEKLIALGMREYDIDYYYRASY